MNNLENIEKIENISDEDKEKEELEKELAHVNPFIKAPLWKRIVVRTAIVLAIIIVCTGALAEFSSSFVVRVGSEQTKPYEEVSELDKVDYIVAPANDISSVLKALEIQSQNLTDTVIISGTPKEVSSAISHLKKEGQSLSGVLTDEAGIDTYNSILRAGELMDSKSMYYCTSDKDVNIGGFVIHTLDINGKVIDSQSDNEKEATDNSNSDSFFNKYYDYIKTFLVVDFFSLDPKYDLDDKPISKPDTN